MGEASHSLFSMLLHNRAQWDKWPGAHVIAHLHKAWGHFCLRRGETSGRSERECNEMTHPNKSETISCLLNQMFPSKDFPGYTHGKSQDMSFGCTGDLLYPWWSHTTCVINFKNKTFSVTPIYTSKEINKPWRVELYSCSESPLSVTDTFNWKTL